MWGYPVIPGIGVLLCFLLAWIGVEHAIRVWFFWFVLATVALYFVWPYWKSPMRNQAPETAPASSRADTRRAINQEFSAN